jgi:hypothetical protein
MHPTDWYTTSLTDIHVVKTTDYSRIKWLNYNDKFKAYWASYYFGHTTSINDAREIAIDPNKIPYGRSGDNCVTNVYRVYLDLVEEFEIGSDQHKESLRALNRERALAKLTPEEREVLGV